MVLVRSKKKKDKRYFANERFVTELILPGHYSGVCFRKPGQRITHLFKEGDRVSLCKHSDVTAVSRDRVGKKGMCVGCLQKYSATSVPHKRSEEAIQRALLLHCQHD